MRGNAPPEASLADLAHRLARSLAHATQDASVRVGASSEGRWVPLGVSDGRPFFAVTDREGRVTTLIAGPASEPQTLTERHDATLADES